MEFWKKKKLESNEKINSDEYEKILKKFSEMDNDFRELDSKYALLMGSYRKMNLKLCKALNQQDEELTEKDKKTGKVYL